MGYFVYIVRCRDNTLYTGITNNLERRIHEHNGIGEKAGAKYTAGRRPVKLVYSNSYQNRSEASSEEYRIKKITTQEKELLINNYDNT